MTDLIVYTRMLINETTATVFTEDAVQAALDVWRWEMRWVPLRPQPTFLPAPDPQVGANVVYQDYYADAQYWESDVVLQDLNYTTITPTTSELFVGHWYFATQPDGIGVRATGKTYDVYRSAADLLGAWAAQVMLDFDFKTSVEGFQRSQKMKAILSLQKAYMARALPRPVRMVQSDAAPVDDGSGVTYPSLRGYDSGMGAG